jgi:acetyltransferase-like isoleucine patch superfamily enzyme
MVVNSLLFKAYYKLLAVCVYRFRFGKFGKKSRIDAPLKLDGRKNIHIGNNVHIHYRTWLGCEPLTDCKSPELIIDDGSVIGNFNHIYSTSSIRIGKNVLTADKVYISDNLHNYEDPDTPIIKQPIRQLAHVTIGDGSWIGENVCIIGASVGKHCIIGANSVVTHDIPDYCVAVGSPARVIKKYNQESGTWEKVI